MGNDAPGANLTGRFRVRTIWPAFDDVHGLFDRTRDKFVVRRHSLKLRYWPDNHPETEAGQVLDLNWEWIKALRGMKIGELRVDDTIGGHDNLRIIFFKGPKVSDNEMQVIWVIRVMQKKRMDFSAHDLATFRARRTLVMERFYEA